MRVFRKNDPSHLNWKKFSTPSTRVAAALLVLGTATTSCKKSEATPTDDKVGAQAAPPVETKFTKVETRKLPPHLEISGALDADERSEVAAQGAGLVLEVPVDLGARVKAGDILVTIDPREASLKLQSANLSAQQQRARLGLSGSTKFDAEKVADVRAAKEALDLAKTEFERSKSLYDERAIAKAQFDQSKTNKERAEAQYEQARNSIDQAYVGLSAAETQSRLSAKSLDDTKIRAPFDGVIAERRISPGEFANMGRVVVVLVKDDPLRFRIDVAEPDVGGIEVGAPVDVRVAAFPDRAFHGVIKRIGGALSPQSRTLPVEAEIANPDRLLKAGFFARGTLTMKGESIDSLILPRNALLPSAGGYRVFVRTGERVTERLVTVGRSLDDVVEVRGQLTKDDEVATQALEKLTDGALIKAL